MLVLTRHIGEAIVIKDIFHFTVESINDGISAIIKLENQQDASVEYLEFVVGEPKQIFTKLSMLIVQTKGSAVRIAWEAPRDWHAYREETKP